MQAEAAPAVGTWKKCGHLRTVETTSGVTARRKGECRICKTARWAEWYERNKERKNAADAAWRRANMERIAASFAAWKKANPGRHARGNWNKNGIPASFTWEAYQSLLAAQGGVCAVCSRPPHGPVTRLDVDHDHSTGAVRGLLCRACNYKVGRYEAGRITNPNLAAKIAAYLEGATHEEAVAV